MWGISRFNAGGGGDEWMPPVDGADTRKRKHDGDGDENGGHRGSGSGSDSDTAEKGGAVEAAAAAAHSAASASNASSQSSGEEEESEAEQQEEEQQQQQQQQQEQEQEEATAAGERAAAAAAADAEATITAAAAAAITAATVAAAAARSAGLPSAEEDCAKWGVSAAVRGELRRQCKERFFPVQRRAIPLILRGLGATVSCSGDVCVSAPTGSGKTLCYVLPIVEALCGRVVPRLRALVVLPSRDLAMQVQSVFEPFCAAAGLRSALAIGQADFATEQRAVLGAVTAGAGGGAACAAAAGGAAAPPLGGVSAIDILVATPGRLVDHLERSAQQGFTLQHLRFLVVDEADRLLTQSYHDWVAKVNAAACGGPVGAVRGGALQPATPRRRDGVRSSTAAAAAAVAAAAAAAAGGGGGGGAAVAGAVAAAAAAQAAASAASAGEAMAAAVTPMRRLLFSATLGRNPRKAAAMGLRFPVYIDAGKGAVRTQEATVASAAAAAARAHAAGAPLDGGIAAAAAAEGSNGHGSVVKHGLGAKYDAAEKTYRIPEELSEYLCLCETGQKPLALLLLLRHLCGAGSSAAGASRTIVFTASLDSTHRLARMLQLFGVGAGGGGVFEYSSSVPAATRAALLKACRTAGGAVRVLVCSDAMTRGMDMPLVDHVVNYDMPQHLKTYVHRVGRTARAGRTGSAFTLLKKGQQRSFWEVLRKAEHQPVRRHVLPTDSLRELVPRYLRCLAELKELMHRESTGELSAASEVPPLGEEVAAA